MNYQGHEVKHWKKETLYYVGDWVYYNELIYECITANQDEIFDESKWNCYGSIHGLWFKIVDHISDLPTLSANIRRLYFVEEDAGWYLWTGVEWARQEQKILPAEDIQSVCNEILAWNYPTK